MKSTYKLFGTIWDGIETKYNTPILHSREECSENYAILSFKKLLSANTYDEVDNEVSEIKGHIGISIDIDYWCTTNSKLSSLLMKRLLQIVTYLEFTYSAPVLCMYSVDSVPQIQI